MCCSLGFRPRPNVRIAIVSPYALDVHGGVQEQAVAMSRELARRGHDVALYAPGGDPVNVEGVAVRQIGRRLSLPANGSRAPITLSPRAAQRVRRDLDSAGTELVHFHEPFAPLLGYAELLRGRRPHVGTFHRSGGGPAYSLTTPILRALLARIDSCVAVSDAAAATLQRATGASCTVLFNGFAVERFAPGVRPVRPTVLFIGRDEERKGLKVLLHAHNLAPDAYDVIAVGRGTIEAVARAGSPGGVRALGPVDDATKRELLGSVSALVAPSLHGESFGLILIEAMASGTPVVASDIEGYRLAAADHAHFFSPGDCDDLNRALTRALVSSDEQRASLRRYAETLSMKSLVDRYEAIYAESKARFARR